MKPDSEQHSAALGGVDPQCPTCGSEGTPIARRERGGAWTRFACAACGLQYWSPRVIDPTFYGAALHDTYERRRRGEAFLRERHHMFLRRARPGRLLDIGCGEGMFLQVARNRGFEVAGIDLDAGNVASARARGLPQIEQGLLVDGAGQLPAFLRVAPPFDWVTAFEVLEHQPDPLGFLRTARRLLSGTGALCGSVPNRERVLADRERRRSDGDFPPHHFLWFSKTALDATLRAAGFTRVVVEPIVERDHQAFAAYLENALLGSVTSGAKRVARRMLHRAPRAGSTSSPADGGGGGGSGRGMMQAGRFVKNAPFVPVAFALAKLVPGRARSLYFEAA